MFRKGYVMKKDEIIYITVIFTVFAMIVFFGFPITDIFDEAMYATSITATTNIFAPVLNGTDFFGANGLFFGMSKIFAALFPGHPQFAVKLPGLIIFGILAASVYFTGKKIEKPPLGFICTICVLFSAGFVFFSKTLSPDFISLCFAMTAAIFGFIPVCDKNDKTNKLCYFAFWMFCTFSVLTKGVTPAFTALFTVLFVHIKSKSLKLFFTPKNIFPGMIFAFLFFGIYAFTEFKIFGESYFSAVLKTCVPILFAPSETKFFINNLKALEIFFFAGILPHLPYLFGFSPEITESFFAPSEKNIDKFTVFCTSGLLIGLISTLLNAGVAEILSMIFFGALFTGIFTYKAFFGEQKFKSVYSATSFVFFAILVLTAVSGILSYLFIPEIAKNFATPFIIPFLIIISAVSMPGLLFSAMKNPKLIFSANILFGILLTVFLPGIFKTYTDFTGDRDIVKFGIIAAKKGLTITTYDLVDKYSLVYYSKNNVKFNHKIPHDKIERHLSNSKNILITLKNKDLTDFDKFFAYEIVETGKQYSLITNITKLPPSVIIENKQTLKDSETKPFSKTER